MKTFTLELVRTWKQRNHEPLIEGGAKKLYNRIPDEDVIQAMADVKEFIRVYGVDELVSSFMNDVNHYELAGQTADVTEVKQDGKMVTVTVESDDIVVYVGIRGRLILGMLTD